MIDKKFGVFNSRTELVDLGSFLFFFTDKSFRATPPIKRSKEKIGRNQPCPCGSNKKYKKCCISKRKFKH